MLFILTIRNTSNVMVIPEAIDCCFPDFEPYFVFFRSAEGFVDRRTLLIEELRSTLSDVETVFQADAKLAVDHNRRFVAEAHAGLNWRLVTPHKVRPFM